jgi:DNA-directed RNA polymerase specialized sigma24 family protein
VNANANRLQRHEPIASDHKSYVPRYELDHREEVQLVLTHLCEYDRWLLETYYGLGYTFEEMSLTLNISKGTVRLHVQAALRRAQEYASDG